MVQVEESEGEEDRQAVSTPRTHADDEWWGGQSAVMFPSGSRHDDEDRGNAADSRVVVNDDLGALVAVVPSHDGALAEAHDVPMAYRAHSGARLHANKASAAQPTREDQPVDDLNGGMSGNQAQGNGRVGGVEAKQT